MAEGKKGSLTVEGKTYELVVRDESRPSKRGGSWVGPAIGLGLVAGAGVLFYFWYKDHVCVSAGDTKCVGGDKYECRSFPTEDMRLFNYWAALDQSCTGEGDDPEEGDIKGDVCNVLGAAYCSDGKYYVCKSNGYAYTDGTECSTEQCMALSCGSSNYKCGGVVSGDVESDYYFDYRCDPLMGRCNFMKVRHNSTVCYRKINSIACTINDSSAVVNGIANPYSVLPEGYDRRWVGIRHAKLIDPPEIVIRFVVKDQFGDVMPNIPIMLTINTGIGIGGIVDEAKDRIYCTSYVSQTDENGVLERKWLWTWNNDKTSLVSITATIYDYDAGKTYTLPIQLMVYGEKIEMFDMFTGGSWTIVAYDNEDRRCRP